MNKVKLIKNLFRSEVIEVAALIMKGAEDLDNDSDSFEFMCYCEDAASELGAEYGFDDKDWEEVRLLSGLTDENEDFINFQFFHDFKSVKTAAGI